ncbi:MAG TPA: DUF2071 domain-containing protein [Verrucomicrobiae bacterium]|nr:DUF2071 domain-containing protein [Verrucomicrobiae bacterium]
MNEPKPPTPEERLLWREDPMQPVVLFQKWRDLAFLHWSFPVDEIKKTLPEGLAVDTFHGKAWVGIIPLFMKDVHPRFVPSVPLLSDFLELNVRTYVLDKHGRPGVWFYSLDANQPLAVTAARVGYFLNYMQAEMSATEGDDGMIDYRCKRAGANKSSRIWYGGKGIAHFAEPGTLEFFLIERYLLFSRDPASGDIHCGRVHHEPYPLLTPQLAAYDTVMLELNGLPSPDRAPDEVHFSPGVDVKTYGLQRCCEVNASAIGGSP